MSLIIQGMKMPKQSKVKTTIGKLKLWTIRNERVNKDEQFGAGGVPCVLWFEHDGTVTIDILGKKYSVVDVPSLHGDLIDRKQITAAIRKRFCDRTCDRASIDCERCGVNIVIDELIGKAPAVIETEEL